MVVRMLNALLNLNALIPTEFAHCVKRYNERIFTCAHCKLIQICSAEKGMEYRLCVVAQNQPICLNERLIGRDCEIANIARKQNIF
jgi:recombinational DNA repair protein RecR